MSEPVTSRPAKSAIAGATSILDLLSEKIVGQQTAINGIASTVKTYQAGLSPGGRPAGVFLLLGPTGTGKTRTVEALAEILHGASQRVVKINCGEFQSDHEVAKLIGCSAWKRKTGQRAITAAPAAEKRRDRPSSRASR